MDFVKDKLYDMEAMTDSSSETAGFLGQRPKSTRKISPRNVAVVRLIFELVLSSTLLFLLVSGSIRLPRKEGGYKRYGPNLPRKDVILGNTAGFGPEVTYNNHEMLWNKTEMQKVHRNWQQLFPSAHDSSFEMPSC